MHLVTRAGALVGRDSEMALLTGLIREVARGRGGSVLIEGEPGIGKSALVRAAVAEAPEAVCEVFWGSGDELALFIASVTRQRRSRWPTRPSSKPPSPICGSICTGPWRYVACWQVSRRNPWPR